MRHEPRQRPEVGTPRRIGCHDGTTVGALGELVVTLTRGQFAAIVSDAVEKALTRHAEGAADRTALLTQAELAQALGVSIRTIHTLRRRGLPTIMVIESPRFHLPTVLDWLEDIG